MPSKSMVLLKPSDKLHSLTYSKKIPLICLFELTRRCNLRCLHCYLDKDTAEDTGMRELTTDEIKNILKQLANSGSLYLTFTGGEIFTRNDIIELVKFARKLKFDLKLFTNGTLVNENIVQKLSSCGLTGIEISLYGRKQIHNLITGEPTSFDKTINTIKLFIRYKTSVTIKSPLMQINFNEYGWLREFSDRLKVRLKLDPAISPKNNGDKGILKYRLTDQQLRQIYSDSSIFNGNNGSEHSQTIPDIFCSAGHNFVFIGFDGTVYPCLQLIIPVGNLRQRKFSQIWNSENQLISGYRNIRYSQVIKCRKCSLLAGCQRCPGLALLEDGNLLGPSQIACRIAHICKRDKNHNQ